MADLVKIEDISYHCLRHTFTTLQSQKVVRDSVIAKMMGHSSVATTQRYLKGRRRPGRTSCQARPR
jgi:integrase